MDKITLKAVNQVSLGFKLEPDSREKSLLPRGILGRSDSQIGRSYRAQLQHFFVSLETNSRSYITNTIAIKFEK